MQNLNVILLQRIAASCIQQFAISPDQNKKKWAVVTLSTISICVH